MVALGTVDSGEDAASAGRGGSDASAAVVSSDFVGSVVDKSSCFFAFEASVDGDPFVPGGKETCAVFRSAASVGDFADPSFLVEGEGTIAGAVTGDGCFATGTLGDAAAAAGGSFGVGTGEIAGVGVAFDR